MLLYYIILNYIMLYYIMFRYLFIYVLCFILFYLGLYEQLWGDVVVILCVNLRYTLFCWILLFFVFVLIYSMKVSLKYNIYSYNHSTNSTYIRPSEPKTSSNLPSILLLFSNTLPGSIRILPIRSLTPMFSFL